MTADVPSSGGARAAEVVLAPPVPAPPPGPGVQPPFVAPPTDGTRHRRATAISLTIAAAFVVLIGGVVGAVGLVTVTERAIIDGSRQVVTRYLTAVQHRDFAAAYALLCTSTRNQVTRTEFASQLDRAEPITDFTVGDPTISSQTVEFDVPVVVRSASGADQRTYVVIQDRAAAAQFRVCGARG
jgi:hypothetical protein